MRLVALALVVFACSGVVSAGCGSSEHERLDAARTDLRQSLAAAKCDYDDTVTNRQLVQDACDDAKNACYGGSTSDTAPTAAKCEAAVRDLQAVTPEDGPNGNP